MRLVTFVVRSRPRLGVLLDDEILDLRRASPWLSLSRSNKIPGSMAAYLAGGEAAREIVSRAVNCFCSLSSNDREAWRAQHILFPLNRARLIAPVPYPGKIICVGMNYPAVGQIGRPEYPPLFLKPANTLVGSGQSVRVPPTAQDVAFEAELALVIGQVIRRVPEARALHYLAGYTLANDLGDRVLEKRTSQWTTGKMMDTFCPLGPALVTPDEVPDPENLEIRTWLNGRLVQCGNTREMFFSVPVLVSYLSHLTTLEPGDVILTGSPKRLGTQPAPLLSLQPGDRVVIEIGSLGRLENPVEAERGL